MYFLIGLVLLRVAVGSAAVDKDCPQIDFTVKDTDGVAFCPSAVEEFSAYSVFRCAFGQAQENLWHPGTDKERKSQGDMLTAFSEHATPRLLSSADELGLQVCRVKKPDDSYLLVYTKPGVKDYNGNFFMLREIGASKVIIMTPHDGSDGTQVDTKQAFASSRALIEYSNGHPKGFANGHADFLDYANTMGAIATQQIDNLFPRSVWLMIHGSAAPDKILYRSRSKPLANAFVKGCKLATNVKKYDAAFNAGYVVDKLIDSNYYLKTEIPARIHVDNHGALAKIVKTIEENKWAWNDGTSQVSLKPSVAPAVLYKYAPHPKEVKGLQTLACLGLKYKDVDRHTDAKTCKDLAAGVGEFYEKSSRGLLKMNTSGFQVNVPFNGVNKNLGAAEKFAMEKHPGYDMYAIVGMFLPVSHAGGKVAHLINSLQRDADHEVGHLEGLGHSGVYSFEDGQWVLKPYGDHDSVMGEFPSNGLTAPQYYHQGWLPLREVALYEPGKTYTLKRINDFKGDGLSAVIVKSGQFHGGQDVVSDAKGKRRDAFISFPTGCQGDGSCLALHLSNDGGSQRIAKFGSEYYDEHFTGIHLKILEYKDSKVTFSIDFDPKP